MTAKQQKQAMTKINKAMLLLQDVQDIMAGTDAELMSESGKEAYKRGAIHQDISQAISNLHWANGRLGN